MPFNCYSLDSRGKIAVSSSFYYLALLVVWEEPVRILTGMILPFLGPCGQLSVYYLKFDCGPFIVQNFQCIKL